MQHKTVTALLIITAISIAAISCEKESEKNNLKRIVKYPLFSEANREFVIQERDPQHPLTNYHELVSGHMKTKSDPGLDSYLGYSFKNIDYPLDSPMNIGFPVLDINKYKNDHPDYYSNIPYKNGDSHFVTFYTFDRYDVKKNDTHKVNGGFNLNFPIFKIGAKAAYKRVWQMSESSINEHVYGEYTSYFFDRKYEVLLPAKRENLLDYLSDGFKNYVYYSAPADLIKSYGCFVISQYYTGAQASILYRGDYTEHSLTKAEDIEREFERTISGTIKKDKMEASIDGNVGFTISNSNSTSSSNKFANIEISARTIGGIPLYYSFSSPKDICSVNYDFSSWCNSLSNQANLTIASIPDNSLIPITDFIEEENLKSEIKNYCESNISPVNRLYEPCLTVVLQRINDNYVSADLILDTRYTNVDKDKVDRYHILKEEVPSSEMPIYIKKLQNTFPYLKIKVETNPDVAFVAVSENDPNLHFGILDFGGIVWTVLFYGGNESSDMIALLREAYVGSKYATGYYEEETARLNNLYPGIKVTVDPDCSFYSIPKEDYDDVTIDYSVVLYDEENYSDVYEKNTAIFKDAKKFIDNKTGKTYILTKARISSAMEKIAFTLYSEEIISDYGFEEIIDSMPLANNMTLKRIKKDYKLIAL